MPTRQKFQFYSPVALQPRGKEMWGSLEVQPVPDLSGDYRRRKTYPSAMHKGKIMLIGSKPNLGRLFILCFTGLSSRLPRRATE